MISQLASSLTEVRTRLGIKTNKFFLVLKGWLVVNFVLQIFTNFHGRKIGKFTAVKANISKVFNAEKQ